MKHTKFGKQLITWYQQHGRHDLPWQKNPTTYRVWISEIMLQQTQVATVIPYYQRFMARFPTLKTLAIAHQDDVLAHWSGLGYYARARNLHRTAQIIHSEHNGRFPNSVEELSALPGIGESTAGAILSFSKKQFAVILDGNVKRVLTRVFAISEPTNQTKTVHALWALATALTPKNNAHHYNQAIMDLGATICTRTKPKCEQCPFQRNCVAYQEGNPTNYPVKIAKKKRPTKQTRLLIIHNENGDILLQKRPNKGIWGGLWSFPECTLTTSYTTITLDNHTFHLTEMAQLPMLTHQFTHFTLEIFPVLLSLHQRVTLDLSASIWYTLAAELPGGVAAPVSNILKKLEQIQ